MKRYLLTIFTCIIMSGMYSQANAVCLVNQDCPTKSLTGSTSVYPKNCERLYNDKCVMYNALNLTCEQQKYKEELDKEKCEKLSQELPALYLAQDRLKLLENSNAPKDEIIKQKRNIKALEKRINKINRYYERKFKSKLCGLQKSKYHEIERLQNREIKECNKNECRKLPKGMRPFAPGYGTNTNCQCEKKRCRCNKR